MPTAAELVADPNLDIDPITAQTSAKKGYSKDELAAFRIGHDDIDKLVIVIYNLDKKGQNKKVNLRPVVIQDAVFEDSIDKTPTFSMTIHDPDWELLNLDAIRHVIDINPGNVPHRHYRLTGLSVADDDITMVFETRNAVYLTYHKRPHAVNRKRMTRAQFILSLVREVKKTRIKFYCPQLTKRQNVRKTIFNSQKSRERGREKGFTESDKITVKGRPAAAVERNTIEKVINAGVDVNAPNLVIVSAVMCIIQESNAGSHTGGNPPYIGAFQQNPKYWPGTGDAYKDAKGYYNAAVPRFKNNPNVDLGIFVANVQGVTGSTNPLNFGYAQSTNKWRGEAQHAVNAYGLTVTDSSGTANIEYKKKYTFNVGEPDGPKHENYLATIYRVAEEVNWRAYWVRDVLHYMSEEDLFKAKARTRLRRYEDGVEHVSFSWDRGQKINNMILSVRMERWVCPIGTVVIFSEGGPAEGRWLVTNIRRSIFDELGEITLSKPMNEKSEPANDPGSREPKTGGRDGGLGGGADSGSGCNLEQVKSTWTPQQIIERCVIPKARNHKMTWGTTAQSVAEANRHHDYYVQGTTRKSWHKGPGALQYAADMGNSTTPTPQMDDLASELIMAFDLPDLPEPRATALPVGSGGPNNIVDAYHKGFHFQLLYRTAGHFGHVHFGVKKEGRSRPFNS